MLYIIWYLKLLCPIIFLLLFLLNEMKFWFWLLLKHVILWGDILFKIISSDFLLDSKPHKFRYTFIVILIKTISCIISSLRAPTPTKFSLSLLVFRRFYPKPCWLVADPVGWMIYKDGVVKCWERFYIIWRYWESLIEVRKYIKKAKER